MASIKELRTRIRSVGNIKQITRAMEMVATTKLRRFQDRATASRPYAEEVAGMVGRLAQVLGDKLQDRPLFRDGEGERTLALLVTSDRGLCGAYNTNLLRSMEAWLEEQDGPVTWYVYGRKGQQYLSKRGFDVERFLVDPPLESTDYRSASVTARMLTQEFTSGQYKDVYLFYTAFESMVKYVPTINKVLPIDGSALAGDDAEEAAQADIILEPDADAIFDTLVPRYLETRFYNALLEALTSEYASRRFAMKNATDAATDMQKALKGIYNKKRQEGITKDLLDIVGGAEAVK